MNDVVKIIDVSHWASDVQWKALVKNGWGGAYIKADAKALEHHAGATEAGLERIGLYFWHDPTLSVDWNVQKALEYLDQMDVSFIVPDIEHYWASWSEWWLAVTGKKPWSTVRRIPGAQISEHAYQFVKELEARAKLPVINYSGTWFINGYAPQINRWINEWPYINADYSGAPEGKTITFAQLDSLSKTIGRSRYLPSSVEKEDIRQYSSKIIISEINDAYDQNIFFGTPDEFDQLIGLKDKPEEPVEVFQPYKGQFTRWAQWIRSGPSRSSDKVGYLKHKDRVTIYEECGEWGRIGEDRWTWLGNIEKLYEEEYILEGAVIANYLWIHTKPNADAGTRDGFLRKGDEVKIFETQGKWYRIERGWISSFWVKEK